MFSFALYFLFPPLALKALLARFPAWSFICLYFVAILYGVSFQQFRHFDVLDPRGLSDSLSYISMSYFDFTDVPYHHAHRIVIPSLVFLLRSFLPFLSDISLFYLVNSVVILLSALVFFYYVRGLNFSLIAALFTCTAYLCSRITIIMSSTPLVDSLVLLSVSIIFFCIIYEKTSLYCFLLPLLLLLKDTNIIVCLLPLAIHQFRRLKVFLSYIISVLLVYSFYALFDTHVLQLTDQSSAITTLSSTIYDLIFYSFGKLFSFSGLHDLQNGFSFFLVFALACLLLRIHLPDLPLTPVFCLTICLSIVFAFLNGNFGRMLFLSYPVVFPYSTIFLFYQIKQPVFDRK